MTETCMCWGIETGDGWYSLLDRLCAALQFNTDRNKYPQVVAQQVKEKFGGLRFYYRLEETAESKDNPDNSPKFLAGMITFAEVMSQITCEACGLPGTLNKGPWFAVRCDACREE